MRATSIVEFPECDDFPRFVFGESSKRVSFAAKGPFPYNFLILGDISKQHRCQWPAKLNEDYVTDEAECCYSVRVNIPWTDDWSDDKFEARTNFNISCFNNSGSHFILHFYRRPTICVYEMEGDKTRLLWQTR